MPSNPRGASAPAFPSTVGQVLSRSAAPLAGPAGADLRRPLAGPTLSSSAPPGASPRRCWRSGLRAGDRVAAFGKNSDAYAAAVSRLRRGGAGARPGQLQRPRRRARVPADAVRAADRVRRPVAGRAGRRGRRPARRAVARDAARRRPGDDADILGWATDPGGPVHEEQGVRDDDLVQLLYTSGTTSQAKGAMLTHRALVHEYVSAIVALRAIGARRAAALAAALPLRADAGLPDAGPGGRRDQPSAATRPTWTSSSSAIPRHGIDSLFLPPTVWVGVANHPGSPRPISAACARRSTAPRSCRCRCCNGCRRRLPDVGFFNCFGQSEIGPLVHGAAPRGARGRPGLGRPLGAVRRDARRRPGDERRRRRRASARSSTARRSCARATGASRRRPPRRSAAAGFTPATCAGSTTRATCSSSTGSRT